MLFSAYLHLTHLQFIYSIVTSLFVLCNTIEPSPCVRSLTGQKLAQLIGNRQKLETAATSQIFSRQIPQYFSASKVHNRTVPLCSPACGMTVRIFNSFTETIGTAVRIEWLCRQDKKDGIRWDWLENSNSSVNLVGQKLVQLIGNRQKLETAATSKIFSRQIPQYFSASKSAQ